DAYLNVVLFAYRTSVHSSLGDTPFHVFYCRDSFTPLERKVLPIAYEYASTSDWPKQRVEKAIRIWGAAHEFLAKRLRIAEQRQNKSAFSKQIAAGDLVMLNVSKKPANQTDEKKDRPSYKLRP